MDQLESRLLQVSNPQDALYRQFWSKEEILTLISLNDAHKQEVKTWLLASGMRREDITDHGDAFEISTRIDCVQVLLSAQFFDCFNTQTGQSATIQKGEWFLPDHICPHIEMITGLYNMPSMTHSLYNMPSITEPSVPAPKIELTQAVASFLNESFWLSDLQKFMNWTQLGSLQPSLIIENVRREKQKGNLKEVANDGAEGGNYDGAEGGNYDGAEGGNYDGSEGGSYPGPEGSLDIQMVLAGNGRVVNRTRTFFRLEPVGSWLYDLAIHFFSGVDPDNETAADGTEGRIPEVLTISYGWWTEEQTAIAPVSSVQHRNASRIYVQRMEREWMKLGLRGVSVLAASGDSGVHGQTDQDCSADRFRPDYPGSSTYVTSVGGTQLLFARGEISNSTLCRSGTCAQGRPKIQKKNAQLHMPAETETAVSQEVALYTSGGGFSNLTSGIPSWQAAHVRDYLQSQEWRLPPRNMWNPESRAYPDLSAIGHRCLMLRAGQLEAIGGTSCSAPLVAGIFSQLNEVSKAKRGHSLGF